MFCLASCQHCGQHIEFPAEGAGMRVPCPHCALETILTEERPATPDAGEEITAAELKAAFGRLGAAASSFHLLPRRPALWWRFSWSCCPWRIWRLPPLRPIASIGTPSTAWRSFRASSGGVQFIILKAILYIGPLLGGSIAVFFMFKPILARRRKIARRRWN